MFRVLQKYLSHREVRECQSSQEHIWFSRYGLHWKN
jgi:hypothetical protein